MSAPQPAVNSPAQQEPRRGLATGWIIGGFAAACVIAMPITAVVFIMSIAACDGTAQQCAAANANAGTTTGWFFGSFALVTAIGILALLVVGLVSSRETSGGRKWRVISLVGMLCMPFIGLAIGYAVAALRLS